MSPEYPLPVTVLSGSPAQADHDLNLPAQEIVQRRTGALVRHVRHSDAGHLIEKLGRETSNGSEHDIIKFRFRSNWLNA